MTRNDLTELQFSLSENKPVAASQTHEFTEPVLPQLYFQKILSDTIVNTYT